MRTKTNVLKLLLIAATCTYTPTLWAQQEDMSTIVDTSHVLSYVVAGLMIGLFVLVFRNRLFIYKEREANTKNRRQNAQLALVLKACKIRVWTYSPTAQRYRLLATDGSVEGEFTPIDFSQSFERDDFERMRKLIFEIRDGKQTSGHIRIKGRKPKDVKQPQALYEVDIEVLERNNQGKPLQIIGMQRDVTEAVRKKNAVTQLLMQYHTVFNQSLVDMVFYNADGVMSDINEKACETFQVGSREELLATNSTISDVPALEGIDFKTMDYMYASSITDLGNIEHPIGELEEEYWGNKIYYEQMMNSIRDKEGNLKGIVMAGRNINEVVESSHRQQRARQLLAKATQDIQTYIDNINYTLRVSDVRLMNYYPNTHELEISSDLNKAQYRLSQVRCIAFIDPSEHRRVKGALYRMDRRREGNLSLTLKTIMHDKQGQNTYLSFHFVPMRDGSGQITHYFGLCRNETEMVYTEMKLKEETQKAQETELLKSSFLMNMSYEIRTPLNAVLGFAELFNAPHDPADEPVFVEQIKQNAGTLLELVNDVLFLSRLDARMVEIKYNPIDFTILFSSSCQLGWSNELKPGVKTIIESSYNKLVVNIDDQNLSQVIQKLTANAAYFTQEGTIRAKYEYRRGELNITIEDTGKGVSKEALANIFNRFATRNSQESHYGTGLGMPIVKELVEQMGGVIELTSEPDKGSTAWVSIPCKLIEYDKKKDILV